MKVAVPLIDLQLVNITNTPEYALKAIAMLFLSPLRSLRRLIISANPCWFNFDDWERGTIHEETGLSARDMLLTFINE